jgi:hypothetical protein
VVLTRKQRGIGEPDRPGDAACRSIEVRVNVREERTWRQPVRSGSLWSPTSVELRAGESVRVLGSRPAGALGRRRSRTAPSARAGGRVGSRPRRASRASGYPRRGAVLPVLHLNAALARRRVRIMTCAPQEAGRASASQPASRTGRGDALGDLRGRGMLARVGHGHGRCGHGRALAHCAAPCALSGGAGVGTRTSAASSTSRVA